MGGPALLVKTTRIFKCTYVSISALTKLQKTYYITILSVIYIVLYLQIKIDAVKKGYIKYMIYFAVTKTLPCGGHFAYCWSYIRLCYPGSTLSSFIPPQQASTSGRADPGSKTEKAFAILDRSAERRGEA